VKPLTDLEVAERLADLRRAAASGGVPLSEHGQWSLAGAQAEAGTRVRGRAVGSALRLGAHDPHRQARRPGYEQFDAFEVTCLRAARLLGLSTAQAWLQPLVDGTRAAVVVRYDRVVGSDRIDPARPPGGLLSGAGLPGLAEV
jgi:hypothetical protein